MVLNKTHVRITDDSWEMGKVTMGCSGTLQEESCWLGHHWGKEKDTFSTKVPFYGILSLKGVALS